MREAPSVVLLRQFIAAGAWIKAYDPEAMEVTKADLPADWFDDGLLNLCKHQYDAQL